MLLASARHLSCRRLHTPAASVRPFEYTLTSTIQIGWAFVSRWKTKTKPSPTSSLSAHVRRRFRQLGPQQAPTRGGKRSIPPLLLLRLLLASVPQQHQRRSMVRAVSPRCLTSPACLPSMNGGGGTGEVEEGTLQCGWSPDEE